MSTKPIVTRFAPSPTGALHIGGARSALFNYHFAKKNNGSFLLRIEDTDRNRNSQEALSSILNGLSWLGIKSDKPPVFQSHNAAQHVQVAQSLFSEGLAYLSYEKKIISDGKTLLTKTDLPSINLKIPTGKTIVRDTVHGEIEFDNQDLGEIVLLRSTQDPTYMLSVVADDISMQVSHVIRGDDHISNTPKQILIYQALKHEIPTFTHMPLIHGTDGKKLSKRHNAISVEEYKNMGYLPEAMCNYLMLLGWNPKAEKEIFSSEELTASFRLEDINKSAARFDTERLNYINLQHIQSMPNEQLLERIEAHVQSIVAKAYNKEEHRSPVANVARQTVHQPTAQVVWASLTPESQDWELTLPPLTALEKARILQALPECKKQNNLNDIAKLACLFLPNFPISPEKDARALMHENKGIVGELVQFLGQLSEQEPSPSSDFSSAFKQFLSSHNYKFGNVGPILRSMLIGKTSSVNVGTIVEILGIKEATQRARAQD